MTNHLKNSLRKVHLKKREAARRLADKWDCFVHPSNPATPMGHRHFKNRRTGEVAMFAVSKESLSISGLKYFHGE